MALTLVRLRLAMQRHSPSWKRKFGLVLGGVAAALTWAAVFLSDPSARGDVVGLALALWFGGWLVGPILSSGAAVLRPEYFSLLPIRPLALGTGLLMSSFVGVGTVVTSAGLLALVGYGALTGGLAGAVVAVPVAFLYLVLVVSLSRAVYALLGAAMRSGLGTEIAAIQFGLLIAGMFAGWLIISPVLTAVPVFLGEGFGGMPAVGDVVAASPAGWPLRAIDAAAAGDGAGVAQWLGILLAATALVAGTAIAMLRPQIGNRTRRRRGSRRTTGRPLLPETRFGAILGKEIRTWWRDPWRSIEIRSGIWFGVFLAAFALIADVPELAALAGVALALMVALSGSNLYGQDGTALWQLVVSEHPDAIRADIRGRQASLILMFAPPAILLSVVMIVVTGRYDLSVPVLAGLIAGFGTSSGVALLMSVVGVTPGVEPQRRINPTDAGENGLVLQVALWLSMLLMSPTLALVVISVLSPSLPGWFSFLTLLVAVINGTVVWWGFGNIAVRRLAGHLTETFGRLRYPGTKLNGREKRTLLDQISALAEDAANSALAAKAAERRGADERT